jgi:replicative DNA helicase
MNESIGWERALLGTVLYNPTAVSHAVTLHPSDFTGCHQTLWSEILSLAQRDALDMRTLVEEMRLKKELNSLSSFETDAIGEDYIRELLGYRGDDVSHYSQEILASSGKKQLATMAALIAAEAIDNNVSYDAALEKAEERIFSLRHSAATAEGVSIADLLGQFNERTVRMREGKIEMWQPQLVALRRIVSFFDDDEYVVVAARPGMGKSSLLRWEMCMSAMDGYPSDIYNIENGPMEYAKWILAMTTKIDSDLLRDTRKMTSEQSKVLVEAGKKLAGLPLTIITLGSPRINEIISIASSRITRNNVKRIAVDYIQLISNGNENRVQDVSQTSGGLRGKCQERFLAVEKMRSHNLQT